MSDASNPSNTGHATQPINVAALRDTVAVTRTSYAPRKIPSGRITVPIPIIGGDEPPNSGKTLKNMVNAKDSLQKLTTIGGFVGACLVDSKSGMMLGAIGGNAEMNLELAAAGNTEVVRAKRAAMSMLKLNDTIEDILITLGKQYHLIRPVAAQDGLFIYLVLDREKANLAMGRHSLGEVEKGLAL